MLGKDKEKANDRQIAVYLSSYDFYWRLNKLLLIKRALEDRENMPALFEHHYGERYFDYEQLTYHNVTNGLLADAASELTMLCEDYFGLLKFVREKMFFVKKMVSYSAGKVLQLNKSLAAADEATIRKLFFIPNAQLVEQSFARHNVGTANQSIKSFNRQLSILVDHHRYTIETYRKYSEAHNQYKHGLKLALNGFGGKIDPKALEQKKNELSSSIFIFENKHLREAAKKGGLMVPDIGIPEIRNNLKELSEERNLLRLELVHNVDIEWLIQTAKNIVVLTTILVSNRMEIINNKDHHQLVVALPTEQNKGFTKSSYTFVLHSDQVKPNLDDYQLRP